MSYGLFVFDYFFFFFQAEDGIRDVAVTGVQTCALPISPTIVSSSKLDQRARIENAAALMTSFAERTGLSSEGPGQRYLWTDAFAVCNFLGLARATGEARYTDLALTLIHRVHHALGQRRPDDAQRGWLSGLLARQAEAHPIRRRSEEHTSELQSRLHLVCRLLLEKKKISEEGPALPA